MRLIHGAAPLVKPERAFCFKVLCIIVITVSKGILVQAFYPASTSTMILRSIIHTPRNLPVSNKAATNSQSITFDESQVYTVNSENLIPQMRENMQKTVTSLKKNLSSVYIGRASPDLLAPVKVRAYGVFTPISQLSTISTVGLLSLTVEPYDSSLTKAILRAIVEENLGLSPTFDGNTIFMDVPPMNEEVRISMGKKCKQIGEDGKVSIRNLRRGCLNGVKDLTKDGVLSQDEEKTFQKQVQKATDEFMKKAEELVKQREKEVTTF